MLVFFETVAALVLIGERGRDIKVYISPTLTYNYQRDYSFKTEQHVSILTLQGRAIIPYTGYNTHVALIQKDAQIGAAKLWYDKSEKQFYLLVSLEIETADPTPETHTGVVGVDVGVRYLAVTATRSGEQTFYTGKRVVPKANHYARLSKVFDSSLRVHILRLAV